MLAFQTTQSLGRRRSDGQPDGFWVCAWAGPSRVVQQFDDVATCRSATASDCRSSKVAWADGGGRTLSSSADSSHHPPSTLMESKEDHGHPDPALQRRLTLRAAITRRLTDPPDLAPSKRAGLGFASGLIAGVVGTITGYPFDTLKTRMQVYGSSAGLSFGVPTGVTVTPIATIRRLFRGIAPPLMSTGIVQTINFGVYDNVLWFLRDGATVGSHLVAVPSLSHYFVAGALGGVAISFITCPASLIKIQLQVAKNDVTYLHIIRQMMKRGLLNGFYRAYLPDVLNQSFGRGVYMMTYEWLKRMMREREEDAILPTSQPQPLYQRVIAGGLAGVLGWLTIYPMDVLKSRMQADALAEGPNKYKSMMDCLAQSYRAGGLASLFSGLHFTLIRAVPVASVILPTYDASYHFLSKYFLEEQFLEHHTPVNLTD